LEGVVEQPQQSRHYDLLKRIAIALATTIVGLALIDRVSLLFAPYDEGIIVAGLNQLRDKPEFLTAMASVFIALFTATLWYSTDKLWRVTNETLRHNEVTTRRELRAYISVEPRGVKRFVGTDLFVGHIAIRNVGRIPAKDISMFVLTDYYLDGSQKDFKIGEIYKSKTALPPRAEMVFGTAGVVDIKSIKPVIASDRKSASGWGGYIFVYGKVTYTDEFQTDGWTEFCHRYPCEMMEDENRISSDYARYHELGGNDAG
jgi:hypothetical protein